MPYIARADGEHFVIPSYRDVLSAKKPALLKKEILLLSGNYGSFITLLRKNADQYEAAFSNEPGYLLGESVWQFFKRPLDLIYCEAIPETTDALLVIVKSGSVYLDGSFPIDSIPDELIVFKTQLGHFEIYIHGDVPISEQPEEGKFSLDAHTVKSFTELEGPVFPTLPTLIDYKLTSADNLLKNKGIGVVPVKKIAFFVSVPALLFTLLFYYSVHQEKAPQFLVSTINPWQSYYDTLNASPAPDSEVHTLLDGIIRLYSAPGWTPTEISYSNHTLSSTVSSAGMKTAPLFAWGQKNKATIKITAEGVHLSMGLYTKKRIAVNTYSNLQLVLASIIDRVNSVYPGMNIAIGDVFSTGPYSTMNVSVIFKNVSIQTLSIMSEQFKDLPLIFTKADITVDSSDGALSGKLFFQALGV